jgi:hypothetical protein
MNRTKSCIIALASILLVTLYASSAHGAATADLRITSNYHQTSTNIVVQNMPVVQGQQNYLSANVSNFDASNTATGATVAFAVSLRGWGLLSPFGPGWVFVGTSSPFDVGPLGYVWSPGVSWIPAESGHHCVRANVSYAGDPYSDDDWAQRNFDIENWTPSQTADEIPFLTWAPEFNKALTVNVTIIAPSSVNASVTPQPPYNIAANGNVSATLHITAPSAAAASGADVIVEGMYLNGTVYSEFEVIITVTGTWGGAVGGNVVPIDKFGLLARYIGLASTILVAIGASAVYVKRARRREEKQ